MIADSTKQAAIQGFLACSVILRVLFADAWPDCLHYKLEQLNSSHLQQQFDTKNSMDSGLVSGQRPYEP